MVNTKTGIGSQLRREETSKLSSHSVNELSNQSTSIPVEYESGLRLKLQSRYVGLKSIIASVVDGDSGQSLFSYKFGESDLEKFAGSKKDLLELSAIATWLGFVVKDVATSWISRSNRATTRNLGTRSLREVDSARTLGEDQGTRPQILESTFSESRRDQFYSESSPIEKLLERPTPGPDFPKGEPRNPAGRALYKGPCRENVVDPSAEAMVFPHDYKCSMVASRAVLGVCDPVKVDFTSCCQDHDIGLWCALRLDPISVISYSDKLSDKLAACIFGKFATAMTEISWYCWVIDFPMFVIQSLLNAILYSIGTDIEAMLRASWKGPDEYFSWDGRNSDSCLCGGTRPTVWVGNHV